MRQIVILTSYGVEKPDKIAKEILSANGSPTDNTETITCGSSTYLTYLCELKTKYYENTIALLPFEGNISDLPAEVLKATEMLMVYFDADSKSFKLELPQLCDILTNNDIGLGLLLTNKLFDDQKQGWTYASVKECCHFRFDVIELCDEQYTDEYTSYAEIVEVLKNNIWSNVKVPSNNPDALDDDMEEQLESFENLINVIQNFKRISNGMERGQMLDEAEKLADLFNKMMDE